MLTNNGFNTLRPRQNGRRFADDTFKRIFFNKNVRISIKISLKFVPKGPINNIPALVQIMAWRRPGDEPLSEAMMVSLLTHICVTRSQWVKWSWYRMVQVDIVVADGLATQRVGPEIATTWSSALLPLWKSTKHDDVIKWKHFPRYWPFVRGIHWSRWIPLTKASDAELWCFLWSALE